MSAQLPNKGRLFDPERQRKLEKFGRKIGYLVALGGALVFAITFWFIAGLWWLSLGLLFGVLALMAGATWLVTHNPTPTVTCLSCGGRGWIDDLVTESGICPMCGADGFQYYRYRGKNTPLSIAKVSGSVLVLRRQEIGLPWI